MQLFLFLFPLQHIKRPALQNKKVVVLRMAFRARKVLGTFEKRAPETLTLKFRPNYSVKLAFLNVAKGIKITITSRFRFSRRLRFEDTKGIMSPEMSPKRFGTFEKRTPGLRSPLFARLIFFLRLVESFFDKVLL